MTDRDRAIFAGLFAGVFLAFSPLDSRGGMFVAITGAVISLAIGFFFFIRNNRS